MTETAYPGAIAMVKIDGTKIRLLREQQGLTQLYVATVVQVTTDTISRWENKKYPTIKKENGLKLAEALGVTLDDIVESIAIESDEIPALPETAPLPADHPHRRPLAQIWPLLVLTTTLLAVIAAFAWYYLSSTAQPAIIATRILPKRCTIGQPFPVIIEVSGIADKPVAIIIKENFPKTAKIKKIIPSLASANLKEPVLKWLHKAEGPSRFAYSVTLSADSTGDNLFSGTIASGNEAQREHAIGGASTIAIGPHHWADSNGDNVINDAEILTVYEQFGDIEALGIDLDLIEEIWLGSGYSWNEKKSIYTILP